MKTRTTHTPDGPKYLEVPTAEYMALRKQHKDLLAAVEGFVSEFGEAMEHDADLPGTDAVNAICRLWPEMRDAMRKAEGK